MTGIERYLNVRTPTYVAIWYVLRSAGFKIQEDRKPIKLHLNYFETLVEILSLYGITFSPAEIQRLRNLRAFIKLAKFASH